MNQSGGSNDEASICSGAGHAGWRKLFRDTRGAQLLEFALALPFLAVMVIGISDFGGAYNLQHILTNAAREGARIAASNSLTDFSCPSGATPCSIQAAAEAVQHYLVDEGESTASCISPSAPSSTSASVWTFSCNNVTLTINRGFNAPGGPAGTVIPSTQVTLSYPYTWTFGQIIGLLVSGATPSLPSTITSSTVMQNLA